MMQEIIFAPLLGSFSCVYTSSGVCIYMHILAMEERSREVLSAVEHILISILIVN
jgi:hypothetical protein